MHIAHHSTLDVLPDLILLTGFLSGKIAVRLLIKCSLPHKATHSTVKTWLFERAFLLNWTLPSYSFHISSASFLLFSSAS